MDILTASILNQLVHTGGHFDKASKEGADISLHGRDLAERWSYKPSSTETKKILIPVGKKELKELEVKIPRYDKNPKEVDSNIHGAGFEAQDKIGGLLQDANFNKASAIMKALYLAGIQNRIGNGINGDIRNLARSSGNKAVPGLLALSALDDLRRVKDPKSTWGVDFTVIDGAPGLLYNKRF